MYHPARPRVKPGWGGRPRCRERSRHNRDPRAPAARRLLTGRPLLAGDGHRERSTATRAFLERRDARPDAGVRCSPSPPALPGCADAVSSASVNSAGRTWLHSAAPLVIVTAFGVAFASLTLANGLVFDDHPGQLYRLAHAVTVGLAPWRWNPGWWAGYAELQFYPPGFAYLGALLVRASLGTLSAERAYQIALWGAYLLPGIATQLLLTRVLRDPWLALPGAFLALTLSAGSRSGVEEGVRWGLVGARLGWGLLPVLARSLVAWVEGGPRVSAWTAPLLTGLVLAHPTHAPAAICLLALAAVSGPPPIRPRLRAAAIALLAALGLAGFWLLPLAIHHRLALPLAWGEPSLEALAMLVADQPLLLLLAAANAVALLRCRRLSAATLAAPWLAGLAPAMAILIVLDAVVLRPLGFLSLPPDRLMDGLFLGLILGASQALWLLARCTGGGPGSRGRPARPRGGVGMSGHRSEPTLTLIPGPRQWPTYDLVARGLRLDDLWRVLGDAPPGRILFLRSAVPLEFRPEWWRPHTHVTALTPLRAGREIIGGTFTHPSPVAGLVYTGSAGYAPITRLVEQLDGVTIFGRPLERLESAEFRRLADRLRVSAVVALDEDAGRLPFLADASDFAPPRGSARSGCSWRRRHARCPRSRARSADDQARRAPRGMAGTGLAYSPLWRARSGRATLATARDDLGLLVVHAPAAPDLSIELRHEPGWAEWTGLAITLVSAAGLARAFAVTSGETRRAGLEVHVSMALVLTTRWTRRHRTARLAAREQSRCYACGIPRSDGGRGQLRPRFASRPIRR